MRFKAGVRRSVLCIDVRPNHTPQTAGEADDMTQSPPEPAAFLMCRLA